MRSELGPKQDGLPRRRPFKNAGKTVPGDAEKYGIRIERIEPIGDHLRRRFLLSRKLRVTVKLSP